MQLEIIDLAQVSDSSVALVNECYRLWSEEYEQTLSAAGERLMPEYFWRAKALVVIRDQADVKSFSLINVMNLALSGVSKLGYFAEMPETTLGRLQVEQTKLFSVEWVTVHPSLRGRLTKLPQAHLIMGVSIHAMLRTECAACVGYSRIDFGADRIAGSFGGVAQEKTVAHGIECNVVLVRREAVISHKSAHIQRAVEELWANRINHASFIKADIPNVGTKVA